MAAALRGYILLFLLSCPSADSKRPLSFLQPHITDPLPKTSGGSTCTWKRGHIPVPSDMWRLGSAVKDKEQCGEQCKEDCNCVIYYGRNHGRGQCWHGTNDICRTTVQGESATNWYAVCEEPEDPPCGRGFEMVNHIYNNTGKLTCECYPMNDQCLVDKQCQRDPRCVKPGIVDLKERLHWDLNDVYTSCAGSTFSDGWRGTEGSLTVSGTGTGIRMHKAACPKTSGFVVEAFTAIPEGISIVNLTFRVVEQGDSYSSPLWVTVYDSADASKYYRWVYNTRSWANGDVEKEVTAYEWHTRAFHTTKFAQKHSYTPRAFRLGLGVYADGRSGTTLVKDILFQQAPLGRSAGDRLRGDRPRQRSQPVAVQDLEDTSEGLRAKIDQAASTSAKLKEQLQDLQVVADNEGSASSLPSTDAQTNIPPPPPVASTDKQTNVQPPPGCDVYVGILSSRHNLQRRQSVRKAWLNNLRKENQDGTIVAEFIIGHADFPSLAQGTVASPSNRTDEVGLSAESERYGDIHRVPVLDDYKLLTDKVVQMLGIGVRRQCRLVVKLDDDMALDVAVAKQVAASLPQDALYYGGIYTWRKQSYDSQLGADGQFRKYMSGPAYSLSFELARRIVDSPTFVGQFQLYGSSSEDVNMGRFVHEQTRSGANVTYSEINLASSIVAKRI